MFSKNSRNALFRRALCALVLCLYLAGFFPTGIFSGFGPGEAAAAMSEPWTGGVATGFAGGDGSGATPYLIDTAEQLAYLAQMVNSDDKNYKGEYFKLTSDIDLGGNDAHQWTPIGIGDGTKLSPDENYFSGTFNGGGHVVIGMRIVSDNYSSDNTACAAGLFSFVKGGGIENVGVTDFVISVDRGSGATTAVGGLAGSVSDGGSITASYSEGSVALSSSSSNSYIGGLAGRVSGSSSIESSYSTGPVYSFSSGSIALNAGGLVGSLAEDSHITSSYATGSVRSSSSAAPRAGGLVGFVTGNSSISSSHSTGSVASSCEGSTAANAGGLVGHFNGGGKITSSYSTGSVFAHSNSGLSNAGGLVGGLADGSIVSSYSTGSATSFSEWADSRGGGLLGSVEGSSSITSSYSTGDVDATAGSLGNAQAGGIAGYFGEPQTILRMNYAWGAVSADAGGARGGLIGFVTNNVTLSNVKSNDWRQDTAGAGNVNIGLNVGIGDDNAGIAVADARSLDVTQFGSANQSDFASRGWDFVNTWCYTNLDSNARPHLKAFFDGDTDTISPDLVHLSPGHVTMSAGETKYVRLSAAGLEKSAAMALTQADFKGVEILWNAASPDVIALVAGELTEPGTVVVSAGISVNATDQGNRAFTLTVLPHNAYASADILAISADIDGNIYNWQQQNDGKTWVYDGVSPDVDLANVDLNVDISPGASVDKTTGHDMDKSVDLTVTAHDGTTRETYTVVTNRVDPDDPDVPDVILDALPEHARAVLTEQPDGTYMVDIYIPFEISFDPSKIESIYIEAENITIVRVHWIDENGNSTEIPHRQAGQHELRIEGIVANRHTLADVVIKNIYVRLKSDTTRHVQKLDWKLSEIPGGIPIDPDDPDDPDDPHSGGGVGCATGAGAFVLIGLGVALIRRREV